MTTLVTVPLVTTTPTTIAVCAMIGEMAHAVEGTTASSLTNRTGTVASAETTHLDSTSAGTLRTGDAAVLNAHSHTTIPPTAVYVMRHSKAATATIVIVTTYTT